MIARRGPQYPKKGKNPRPKAKHRKTKTRRTGENRVATTVGTMARPWWTPRPVVAATVRPWWSLLHPVVRFFFGCLFVFRQFLLCFVFILAMYLDIQRTQFTPQPSSSPLVLVQSFQREKERKGEDCKDPGAGLAIERREHVLDELSFSSLFSI